MYEAYKISITVALLVILSFFLTKTITLSIVLLALALFYHFNFEYYPPQRRVGNKVIRFSLKVRNSKINDVFSSQGQMHNNSNSGLWLKSGYGAFSPNNSGKMEPKITSTPLPRVQQRIEPLLTPRPAAGRYSLSDMSMSQIAKEQDRPRSSPVQNVSGPLLASTRYHNNVGTYMDSKSPGLSSRIVQYSKDAERRPTHQAKYGRPGVFPVVHLFNKEKIVSPKPKTVTLRFAPSDTLPHYSPEQSRLLLNGAFKEPVTNKTSPLLQSTPENDTSTRSVLDALKEISRKRIHTNEDLEDTLDPCKKQKKDTTPKEQYQKRAREESPQNDSTAKRSCFFVDPLAASITSSERYRQQLEKGVKRKEILENKRKEKVLKVNQDVETQTATVVAENRSKTEQVVEDERDDEEQEVHWVPVFDDRPLAEARKKRLAKLLGSLTGLKPYIEPPQDKTETFASRREREEEEKKKKEVEEKKLVSILSPPNKAKHDKHVTFNVAPEITSVESIPVTTVVATIVSSVQEKAAPPLLTFSNSNTITVTAISSPVTTSLPISTNATSAISPVVSTPTFTFGKSPPATTTPPKIGGFKFNVASPATPKVSIPTTTSPSTIGGFKIPATTSVFTPLKKNDNTIKSDFKLPPGQSFALPSSLAAPISSFKIVNPTTSQNINNTTSSPFTLNTVTSATSPSSGFAFSKVTTTVANTTSSSSGFAFSKAVATAPNTTTSSSSSFGFSKAATTTPSATTSTSSGFGFSTAPVTATSTIAFNTTAAKPFTFSAVTKSSTLFSSSAAIPTTSSDLFTTTSDVTKNMFSPSTANSDVAKTFSSSGGFGTTTTFSFNPTTTAASGFGVPKTTTNIFGTTAPTFGQNSTVPAFGVTKSNAPSIFAGTTTTTAASTNVFGTNPPAFGAVTTATIFGAPTTTASSIFRTATPSAPVFGTPTTSAPAYGTAVTTTAASVFGTPFAGATTTTTVTSSLFSSSAPTFGTPATTAEVTKPANVFSSGNPPNFGSSFGTNPPFNFGASKPETPKAFGVASTPSFGLDKAGGFGSAAASPTFGGFNTSATKPAFGAASPQTSNMFPSAPFATNTANPSNLSFGNTSAPVTFGAAANNTAKEAAFNFGASTEPPKPGGFNFGATATPSFGTGAAPAFGGGSFAPPQFNAPAAGTFSIGSGSAPNRSRMTLKAKRRN